MLVELLLVLGFVSSFQAGDACIDALHEMRVMERMRIVSTETLEDNVIAFTLTDGPRVGEKTAILVCVRDVDDEEALGEDPTAEDPEDTGVDDMIDDLDDGSGDEEEEDPASG